MDIKEVRASTLLFITYIIRNNLSTFVRIVSDEENIDKCMRIFDIWIDEKGISLALINIRKLLYDPSDKGIAIIGDTFFKNLFGPDEYPEIWV